MQPWESVTWTIAVGTAPVLEYILNRREEWAEPHVWKSDSLHMRQRLHSRAHQTMRLPISAVLRRRRRSA